MAYDKEKAHEYYLKYRKKGLKKGRKKGRKKTGTSTSLVGVSTSGLNDNGRIEAGIIKDRIKKEMNAELSKAKTDADKERIRAEYSKKAQAEISKLKSDPQYAKPKATRAKSAGSKASRSSGGGGSSRTTSGGGRSGTKAKMPSVKTASSSSISKSTISNIKNTIESLRRLMPIMTPEMKKVAINAMKSMIKTLKASKGLSAKEEMTYNAYIKNH